MRLLFGMIAAMLLSVTAQAENADIEGVIGDQLDAFNERDVEGAWQFASPMIQGLFQNSRNFGAMVENGYPMVWTNREVEFLDLREENGQQVQRILVRDASGAAFLLDYAMIETSDGWRINGVQLVPTPDVSA